MTTVLLVIMTIVAINAIVVAVFFYMKSKKVNEPINSSEPTTEPEKPVEPKFKVGDWIVGPSTCNYIFQILDIGKDSYKVGEHECILFENEKFYRLWDITKDAKDGDVLTYKADNDDIWLMVFMSEYKPYDGHIHYHFLYTPKECFSSGTCAIEILNLAPATKEQREQLEKAMSSAGYKWDSDTKTLSKIEEPAPEPEPVEKSMFKKDDWITDGKETMLITEVTQGKYIEKTPDGDMTEDAIAFVDKHFHLWTIEDAKNGDVLSEVTCTFILKKLEEKSAEVYCVLFSDNEFIDGCDLYFVSKFTYPATKEQRDLLFSKMAEAGYTWDAETKTLSKIEEPAPEPIGTEEPTNKVAFDLIDYFSSVVKIEKHSKTYNYLLNLYDEAFLQFKLQNTTFGLPILYKKENFPTVCDYYGDKENEYAFEQLCAWLFALILEDIVPEHAEELVWMAYNYKINGANQPMYGYTFETDPHIARMVAGNIWAMTKIDDITQLREELGSKMVTYNKDISELYIHTELFMPTAPGPYLDEYKKRPKGLPVDANLTEHRDKEIHGFVSNIYNLSTDLPNIRQITFQAIANKDYHVEHLFGKPRTFIHPQYGEVTVYPVFGEHNIGICIPEDSEIATLCYEVGKNSSNNRKSLLNQEYGRRRPGQGEKDGTRNDVPEKRVLVDYPTEEYDGHSTGYYNQGGDYIDGNGNHIGDYNTYYQKAVYANSYPSGHSADIEAICNTLIRIMPELANLIIKAKNEFANSRIITRYHYQSDTIIGREIGTMFLPLMEACTNCNMKERYDKARQEYERIKNGETPTPQPEAKVNVTLGYSCGGYGSCHVDPGETSISHKCNKEANRDRQPSITCSQTVNFTIEGAGVTAAGGKTSGVWEAGKSYVLFCPAVKEGEEKIATITLKNENGIKILYYKCSWNPTHDDGAGKY